MSDRTLIASYNDIVKLFDKVPITYIPGLLHELVLVAIKKKVFKPGMVNVFVASVERSAPKT